MAKKIIAVLLALALVSVLAACGKKQPKAEEVVVPEKKVAIIIAPEAEAPEEFKAAKEIAAKYPDNIIIKECADTRILVPGDSNVIKFAKDLAADKTVGAIIFDKASNFTSDAIREAKTINPEIRTICVEPECSIDALSEKADAVFCFDREKFANDIVGKAKEQGADSFLMFSFNRHITKNPLYAAEREYIEKACAAQDIKFKYDNAQDPFNAGGMAKAQLYVKEAVSRLIRNKDVEGNIAVYSTDSCVQSTLVSLAESKGLIYVSPAFPTLYLGAAEALKAEKSDDPAAYLEALKKAAAENTGSKAKLSVYNYPLATKVLNASVNIAFDMLGAKTTAENLSERAAMRLNNEANDEKFTVEAYPDESLINVFEFYYPAYEIIK